MEMKKCESCGMPMLKAADFGGKREGNRYCVHCSYPSGELMARHLVRENMVIYYMKMKRMERADAEGYVDRFMAGMPAWQ
jgi:hypothetical protein